MLDHWTEDWGPVVDQCFTLLSMILGVTFGEGIVILVFGFGSLSNTLFEPKKKSKLKVIRKNLWLCMADKHGQIWKVSLMIVITVFICFRLKGELDLAILYTFCGIWFILRYQRCFDSSFESIEILEENRSMVATVLAANSWFSFYEKLLHSESEGQNLFSKFTEHIKDTNERCLERSMDLQMQLVDSFNKLIILLPRNCEVEIKEDEGIFTSSELRNNKKTQKVYWIYRESSEEEAFFNGLGRMKQSDRCGKIFVMLDFPHVLKSVLGPGEKKGFDTHPEARRRNLKKFRKVIKGFIEAHYRQHRNDVLFLEFPGHRDRSYRLSYYVRAEFMRHQEQQTYASSSSDSDV